MVNYTDTEGGIIDTYNLSEMAGSAAEYIDMITSNEGAFLSSGLEEGSSSAANGSKACVDQFGQGQYRQADVQSALPPGNMNFIKILRR